MLIISYADACFYFFIELSALRPLKYSHCNVTVPIKKCFNCEKVNRVKSKPFNIENFMRRQLFKVFLWYTPISNAHKIKTAQLLGLYEGLINSKNPPL